MIQFVLALVYVSGGFISAARRAVTPKRHRSSL